MVCGADSWCMQHLVCTERPDDAVQIGLPGSLQSKFRTDLGNMLSVKGPTTHPELTANIGKPAPEARSGELPEAPRLRNPSPSVTASAQTSVTHGRKQWKATFRGRIRNVVRDTFGTLCRNGPSRAKGRHIRPKPWQALGGSMLLDRSPDIGSGTSGSVPCLGRLEEPCAKYGF